jgi:multicomponent Na+:H+ antiporter subunit B
MTSLILRAMAPLLICLLLVFSLLFLVRGHGAPGGGFIGGLIAVAALLLQALIHGAVGLRRLLRVQPARIAAAGVLLAACSGIASWVVGEPLLTPLWAEVKVEALALGTPMLFDVGVYLVVVGFGGSLLEAVLGEE